MEQEVTEAGDAGLWGLWGRTWFISPGWTLAVFSGTGNRSPREQLRVQKAGNVAQQQSTWSTRAAYARIHAHSKAYFRAVCGSKAYFRACNLSTWETETGGAHIRGYPGLCSQILPLKREEEKGNITYELTFG